MMNPSKLVPLVGAIVLSLAAAFPAHAESDAKTGTGALSANARLDFQIIIPKFIRFQVGSAGSTIDMVEFNVAAADVGSGTALTATTNGTVPVSLKSNGGAVSLTGTTLGAMGTGTAADGTISFSEIESTSDNASLAAPTLADAATSSAVNVAVSSGNKVVDRTANWTFKYKNTNIVGAGTYGGAGVRNGRVTYTASLP